MPPPSFSYQKPLAPFSLCPVCTLDHILSLSLSLFLILSLFHSLTLSLSPFVHASLNERHGFFTVSALHTIRLYVYKGDREIWITRIHELECRACSFLHGEFHRVKSRQITRRDLREFIPDTYAATPEGVVKCFLSSRSFQFELFWWEISSRRDSNVSNVCFGMVVSQCFVL